MKRKYYIFLLVFLFCFASCDTLTYYTTRVSVDKDPTLTEDMLDFILGTANAASGQITVSLLWDTGDDLDLHVITPAGVEIFFWNMNADGGTLDVDMNAEGSTNIVLNPVENIFFSNPKQGSYTVKVENYYDRTPGVATNYLVRIKIGSNTKTFTGSIDDTGMVNEVAVFTYP